MFNNVKQCWAMGPDVGVGMGIDVGIGVGVGIGVIPVDTGANAPQGD